MALKGGSLSFSFFLPIDMDQRLSVSSARAPVQSRVIPLSSDEGMGDEGCTSNSGMAVDGLKSTSDVGLTVSFREEGDEEREDGSLAEGKEFKGGVWGCPITDDFLGSVELGSATFFCFKRASRRAFNFSAL
jgi:hypothetical protein